MAFESFSIEERTLQGRHKMVVVEGWENEHQRRVVHILFDQGQGTENRKCRSPVTRAFGEDSGIFEIFCKYSSLFKDHSQCIAAFYLYVSKPQISFNEQTFCQRCQKFQKPLECPMEKSNRQKEKKQQTDVRVGFRVGKIVKLSFGRLSDRASELSSAVTESLKGRWYEAVGGPPFVAHGEKGQMRRDINHRRLWDYSDWDLSVFPHFKYSVSKRVLMPWLMLLDYNNNKKKS
ncbi:hypothetical protein DMENIID0001_047920 [Sergentomyia squamirostris]